MNDPRTPCRRPMLLLAAERNSGTADLTVLAVWTLDAVHPEVLPAFVGDNTRGRDRDDSYAVLNPAGYQVTAADLGEYEVRDPYDPAQYDDELWHGPCGKHVADVLPGDTLAVLAGAAAAHAAACPARTEAGLA